MPSEKAMSLLRIVFLAFAASLSACVTSTEETRNAQPEPTPVAVAPAFTPLPAQRSPAPATQSSTARPPTENEIKEAVARVFQKAALPKASGNPAFVIGDFNGDGSPDLAVLVKPGADSLGEINNELANWVLEDPRKIAIQKTNSVGPPKPVRAETGEVLLAVIHGAGPQGWRNPEAKQTYLLKNTAATNLASQSKKDLQATKDKQKLPPLRGDAISETVGGSSGLLYWTGAKYAWYRTAVR